MSEWLSSLDCCILWFYIHVHILKMTYQWQTQVQLSALDWYPLCDECVNCNVIDGGTGMHLIYCYITHYMLAIWHHLCNQFILHNSTTYTVPHTAGVSMQLPLRLLYKYAVQIVCNGLDYDPRMVDFITRVTILNITKEKLNFRLVSRWVGWFYGTRERTHWSNKKESRAKHENKFTRYNMHFNVCV